MKELLEAGVHFGHQTKRWNPKMKEYIFGERNGIYIIDLQKTLKMFKEASKFVQDLANDGRIVLFVGTKRQAQDAIAEEAQRCGMFYITPRWLGGLLTNWVTRSPKLNITKAIVLENPAWSTFETKMCPSFPNTLSAIRRRWYRSEEHTSEL